MLTRYRVLNMAPEMCCPEDHQLARRTASR